MHSTLHFAKNMFFIAPQIGYRYLVVAVTIIYYDHLIVVFYRTRKSDVVPAKTIVVHWYDFRLQITFKGFFFPLLTQAAMSQ